MPISKIIQSALDVRQVSWYANKLISFTFFNHRKYILKFLFHYNSPSISNIINTPQNTTTITQMISISIFS